METENCPFLTLTVLPVCAAATSRSVCLQRNAGTCTTSTTLRGLPDFFDAVDVRQHGDLHPFFHFLEDGQAFLNAGSPVRMDGTSVGFVVGRFEDIGKSWLIGRSRPPETPCPGRFVALSGHTWSRNQEMRLHAPPGKSPNGTSCIMVSFSIGIFCVPRTFPLPLMGEG